MSAQTAAIDPWLLLVRDDGEPALYGYCHSHHRLGGLSWVLSSRLLSLDEAAGTARTQSGTLYLLGRRIDFDDLPDDEARAALEVLTYGDNCSSVTRAWLAACKAARWLGLQPPPRSDAAAIHAFLKKHGTAYRALRCKVRANAGPGSSPNGANRLEDGRLSSAVAEGIDESIGPTPTPLTVEARVIFRAKRHGDPVIIARADRDEIVALADGPGSEPCRDKLDAWSLIAIRGLSRGTSVHALGWRVGLANTWITSAVAGISLGPLSITTTSGHAYRLLTPDGAALRPALREHLDHALQTWGFDDIQPE